MNIYKVCARHSCVCVMFSGTAFTLFPVELIGKKEWPPSAHQKKHPCKYEPMDVCLTVALCPIDHTKTLLISQFMTFVSMSVLGSRFVVMWVCAAKWLSQCLTLHTWKICEFFSSRIFFFIFFFLLPFLSKRRPSTPVVF